MIVHEGKVARTLNFRIEFYISSIQFRLSRNTLNLLNEILLSFKTVFHTEKSLLNLCLQCPHRGNAVIPNSFNFHVKIEFLEAIKISCTSNGTTSQKKQRAGFSETNSGKFQQFHAVIFLARNERRSQYVETAQDLPYSSRRGISKELHIKIEADSARALLLSLRWPCHLPSVFFQALSRLFSSWCQRTSLLCFFTSDQKQCFMLSSNPASFRR